jgi:pyruvate dehydrogenase E1 component alpha subunit
MPGVIVDGMDVVAVHEAAGEAIARARAGEGPSLVEAKTYRFFNHHGVQNLGLKYRSDDEVAQWRQRDPISLLEQRVLADGSLGKADLDATWAEARAEIEDAIAFAEASPLPDPASLLADVYTETLR